MPLATRFPRRSAALLVATALAALIVLAGCSSSNDDTAAGGTTTSSSSSLGTSATTGSTSSTGSQVTAPSTIPASVDGTCAALAETYGLGEIQPKNTVSWVDERQRIVVDAQREAGLLGAAQKGAPADLVARLATMQAYASWLATTVQGVGSFSEAVTALEAYPDQVGVSLAIASVQTWQKANCPE
jgi:hypothetical protein